MPPSDTIKTARDTLVSFALWLQAHVAWGLGEIVFNVRGRRPRGARGTFDPARIENALVARLDELGDVVLFTAFLRAFRNCFPQAHITLIVKPEARALVEHCPYVNEVLVYRQNVARRLRPLLLPWRAFRTAQTQLWSRRFDLAVVPRWDTDTCYATFLAFWSGAPWRVGFSESVHPRKQILNRGFDRLLTHALEDATLKHEVEHSHDLIRFFGGEQNPGRLELWLDEQDQQEASRVWAQHGLGADQCRVGGVGENTLGAADAPVVVFGPSGGHSILKQWPLERFAALGRWLVAERGCRVLVVGGPGEEALGRALEEQIGWGAVDLVGQTTLRQMAALIQRSQLYVGNDSGPLHIASAVGCPVIALFGSSCTHRYRPWQNATVLWHELPCSPCAQCHARDRCQTCLYDQPRCMAAITVEEVQAAVEAQLGRTKQPRQALTRAA